MSGAIIEIKPKPFIGESDPKLALRIGAARAGYLNQHIHGLTAKNKKNEQYVTKDAHNRVQRAVSDLLRQFAILPATPLIDLEKDRIEPNLWLTCFYVLRRTRKTNAQNIPLTVALMVRVNPVNGLVEVTTPSLFFSEKGWVSYPEALQSLLREKWDPDSYSDETISDTDEEERSNQKKGEQNLLNKFVCECLRDCLSTPIQQNKDPRVLFTIEAQNARKELKWLQNPHLPANDLPDPFKQQMNPSEINRLWVVRLRTYKNGEVPVGIVKSEKPGGRTSGVVEWKGVCDEEQKSLYFSIREPLTTEKYPLKKNQSRLDSGSQPAANTPYLEIAIVHHPEIDRHILAKFIHSLRYRWPYFADYVSLPLPFPFAIKAKEYAVSPRDTNELESSEEEIEES